VVLGGRRREVLERLSGELGGTSRALAVTCDVTEWEQVRGMVDRATEAYGRLDVAFANAGLWSQTSFVHDPAPPEEWREMVLTNVYGPAITARAVLPALLETKGHLVITGSVGGRIPTRGSLYSATKWAVTGLAQNLRAELADTGVRVTVVQPGLVDTGMIDPSRAKHPKLRPDDVARAVLYAVEQPPGVDVNEIVLRPTGQVWHR
jgi:NADP-dependent 3-hydroxy acid dehydrogenase YdfG